MFAQIFAIFSRAAAEERVSIMKRHTYFCICVGGLALTLLQMIVFEVCNLGNGQTII